MLKRLSKKKKLVRGKEKLLGLKRSCAFFYCLKNSFGVKHGNMQSTLSSKYKSAADENK